MLTVKELEKLVELNAARVYNLAQNGDHLTKVERTERCFPG